MTVTVHRIGGAKSGTWYFEGVGELPDCRTEVTHLISVPDGTSEPRTIAGQPFAVVTLPSGENLTAGVLVQRAELLTFPDVAIVSTIV